MMMPMIERRGWTRTFGLTLFAFQILMLSVESYNLKCPSNVSWKFRAQVKCNRTLKYTCLYSQFKGKYVEGCDGPAWDRKGSKRIYAGDFSRGKCFQHRFQPFLFWTNGSMSDCIFSKSLCSDEGQLVYKDQSTKIDRVCRCDYTKNYSFIKTPKNMCFCIPTEEDCSCHLKSCPGHLTLSADYNCTQEDPEEILQCKDIIDYNKHMEKTITGVFIENNYFGFNDTISRPKRRDTVAINILVCLCIMYMFGIANFGVLCPKWTVGKLQPLNSYIQKRLKVSKITKAAEIITEQICIEMIQQDNGNLRVTNEQVNQPFKLLEITQDEAHYLRLIHLLFRVACPIVRMKFNIEIQPNKLPRTLDKYKRDIEMFFRKKEGFINDSQWDVLFGLFKGKTVTSEDFEIILMIYLLRIIGIINIGNLYPVQSDRSIGAMLSRILFIRNEAAQFLEGKIPEDQFNQYWDDIGQAVLHLVVSFGMDIVKYQNNKGLIDGLRARSVQIPQDFTLPQRIRKFKDIAVEENNFLVVVHELFKIVYPVIINELNTRHHRLNATEQHCKSPSYDEQNDKQKTMDLSQKHSKQHCLPKKELNNSDLKLMHYSLKEKINKKENTYYLEQLDVINEIRREIVESSSGILNEIQFRDIMGRISKVVLYLGEEKYKEELSSLCHIQNISEYTH